MVNQCTLMHTNVLFLKRDIKKHCVCVMDNLMAQFIVTCAAVQDLYWQRWCAF